MTTILFIILGISIGVGCTLIFLQERFLRERQLVIAASEAEREKAANLLKELDEKWEQECAQYKEELAAIADTPQSSEETANLENALQEKESQLVALTSENKQLRESASALQAQITELQTEVDFHKGEIKRLEEENKNLPTDDFIVLPPRGGGHLLPGSVARALMKKRDD